MTVIRFLAIIPLFAALPACEPEKKKPALWSESIPLSFDAKAERFNYDAGYFHKNLQPPYSREQAFTILIDAEGFYPERGAGRIMDQQVVPSHVRSFGVILNQPDAAAVFADLAKRGSPAGQLYGFSGLFLTDRAAFEARLPDFRQREDLIHIGGQRSMRMRDIVDGSNVTLNIMDGTAPAALREGARLLGPQ